MRIPTPTPQEMYMGVRTPFDVLDQLASLSTELSKRMLADATFEPPLDWPYLLAVSVRMNELIAKYDKTHTKRSEEHVLPNSQVRTTRLLPRPPG